MTDDNDGRNLPLFDNHYSNTTLIDNWQEDRCQFNNIRNISADGIEETQKERISFTLTGVNTEDYIETCKKWAKTKSTYKQNYDANLIQNSHPAAIIKPPSVDKTLLLSGKNADYDTFVGEPTSKTYGAHYATQENSIMSLRAYNSCLLNGNKVHNTNVCNKNRPENLYESLEVKEQNYHRAADTKNQSTNIEKQNNKMSKTQNKRSNEYMTTKQMADKKVDAFYFQRRLPPMY